jgi:hypothetical protein
MKAALIESDIFRSRIDDYTPQHLDSLISTTELEWFGAGKELVAFRFTDDRDITGSAALEKPLPQFVPEPHAYYSYFTLMQRSNLNSENFSDQF